MINDQLMTLSTAAATLVFVLGSMRWLDSRFNRIEKAVDKALTDRWTRTDHRLWALELKLANPSIIVPAAPPVLGEEGFTLDKS